MRLAILILISMVFSGCVSMCADCNDFNPCTRDFCDVLACRHENIEGKQPGCDSIVPPCRMQNCSAGSCILVNISNCCGNGICESNEDISNCPVDCSASIKLDCNIETPVIPILHKLEDELGAQFVSCTLVNTGTSGRDVMLNAEIPGWTNRFSESATLLPGVQKQVDIRLDWKEKLYTNRENSDASINFIVEASSVEVASQTKKVTIAPKEDILWSIYTDSEEVSLLHSLVAWVTPHDACISSLMSKAKELAPGRSLGGYADYGGLDGGEKANRTIEQSRAIYYAIKGQGVSYVNTLVSFSGTQHVNMPADSLLDRSGNCVDGSVLFASAFEALGMNTVIVFIPRHTFVGVETYPDSGKYVFIETTMVGSSSFEEAYNEGSRQFDEFRDSGNISYVHVAEYRAKITPYPGYTACSLNQPCIDGTKAGECSLSRPKLCAGGTLVDAASVCGCPGYERAFGDSCYSSIIKNETFVLGKASYDRTYFWGPNQDPDIFVTYQYKVSSTGPIKVFIVPDREDYDKLKAGADFMHYPVYAGTNTLSYDQLVTHEGNGGIAFYNDGGSSATVTLQVFYSE